MFLKSWTFITLSLAALLMGTSLCHVLEMPAKLQMAGPLWMTLQHTLYRSFASVGGTIEIGAILFAAALAFLVRNTGRGFFLALTATICLALAFFVVWLLFTNPVNAEVSRWAADAIPADWMRWRRQWEYSHAVRFALHGIAFGALLLSVLSRTRPA
jgi:hypothetical protein